MQYLATYPKGGNIEKNKVVVFQDREANKDPLTDLLKSGVIKTKHNPGL